jgi:DNA-binding transcriptional LysR family regulator
MVAAVLATDALPDALRGLVSGKAEGNPFYVEELVKSLEEGGALRRVGTRYELGLSWLCPALAPLARKRPERTLHLYNGDSPVLVAQLARGDRSRVHAPPRRPSRGDPRAH